MKKVLTVLMAVTIVFGFAGMASALTAINCGDGGSLSVPGCDAPGEQQTRSCGPFDFETSICSGIKQYNRAIFPICDCIPTPFSNVIEDQEFGISMKILVDKGDGQGPQEGDNFVYWSNAGWPGGLEVQTFSTQAEACEVDPLGFKSYIGTPVSVGYFGSSISDFEFDDADGDDNDRPWPDTCAQPANACDNDFRVVEFEMIPRDGQTVGYLVTDDDEDDNASNWVVDIPPMWVDWTGAQAGWTVYVEVCFELVEGEGSGICGDCLCCFDLEVGSLCCEGSDCEDVLIFPYFPKEGNFWLGMAVTNTSSEDGDVLVELYENDGDTATGTFTIPANETMIVPFADLDANGTLGDAQSYVKATAAFQASGFAMFGNNTTGVAMGYLAEKQRNCDSCSSNAMTSDCGNLSDVESQTSYNTFLLNEILNLFYQTHLIEQ